MATSAGVSRVSTGDVRFFTVMAWIMAITILAGFTRNLATGLSSFAVPAAYHVHAVIFMGWVALYLAQATTMQAGAIALHVRLGKLAYAFIPAMMIAGTVLMVVVTRRNGGPFFFSTNEFLVSNTMVLWTFGGLAWWALKRRRYDGWHRRLMLCAMAILTGPGLGRLLPMPLFIPYAWPASIAASWIFPVIGMIADKRMRGQVHPAYYWGLGIYVAVFAISMAIAYSPPGYAMTEWMVSGTLGAERPMSPFLPPEFAM